MSQGEVYEALQRGVLDGTSGAPIDVMADRDFYEVAPNIVDMNYGNYAIAANVISLKTWNALPKELQDVIADVSDDYIDDYLEIVGKAQAAACTELKDGGAKFTVVDWKSMKSWADSARDKVVDVWKKDVSSSGSSADATAFLKEYRAALADNGDSADVESATARCAAQG